jgi:methyltransferase (TIGR00027 family)
MSEASSTIQNQPSKTAMGVAFLRAVAALDEREEIRGWDNLAEIFLIEQWRGALKDRTIREAIAKKVLYPGAYEYILARTAFVDGIIDRALRENIPQIVFLGAGYDSRPYRFRNFIKQTHIFELDAPATQQSKRELLRKADIVVPQQVVFVPINFSSESLKDALFGAGFTASQKTLFIWEGVTMYLSTDAIDDTLRSIRSVSAPGSLVFFDYHSLWAEMVDAYGVKELRQFHETNAPGEPLQFGIERGKIESFLSERGYEIVDHLTATDVENRYLTLRDGSVAGRIPELLCFAHASVVV